MNILLFGAEDATGHRRKLLRRAVRAALGRHARRRGELCVIFVSDAAIRKTNRRYLGHDYPTDVLAFPYAAAPKASEAALPCGSARSDAPSAAGEAPPFGDIYIARGVARRQARALGHGELSEWLVLAVHGTLHLTGFDDRKAADRRRMFARQERILRRLRPSLAQPRSS